MQERILAFLVYLLYVSVLCFLCCSLLGLPRSFSLAGLMSSEAQQLTWQGQGLPSDALSAQNALAILHGVMTPLVIDPSSQVCRASVGFLQFPALLIKHSCPAPLSLLVVTFQSLFKQSSLSLVAGLALALLSQLLLVG
jgi:hypothetical protein